MSPPSPPRRAALAPLAATTTPPRSPHRAPRHRRARPLATRDRPSPHSSMSWPPRRTRATPPPGRARRRTWTAPPANMSDGSSGSSPPPSRCDVPAHLSLDTGWHPAVMQSRPPSRAQEMARGMEAGMESERAHLALIQRQVDAQATRLHRTAEALQSRMEEQVRENGRYSWTCSALVACYTGSRSRLGAMRHSRLGLTIVSRCFNPSLVGCRRARRLRTRWRCSARPRPCCSPP